MPAGTHRTTLAAYAGVFLCALAVRLVALFQGLDNPSFDAPIIDAGEYDAIARRLVAGEDAGPRLFWQPFFYPVYLALVYKLSAGSILAAKLSQAVLGGLTCCLALALGWRLFDRRTGLAAAAMTALYGPLVLFESELLATGWAAFWAAALTAAFVAAPARFGPASASPWVRSAPSPCSPGPPSCRSTSPAGSGCWSRRAAAPAPGRGRRRWASLPVCSASPC